VDVLSECGRTLGRPLVDTLTGSKNLKELRPRQTTIRVLFVFDPWRSAIPLVAGDKGVGCLIAVRDDPAGLLKRSVTRWVALCILSGWVQPVSGRACWSAEVQAFVVTSPG